MRSDGRIGVAVATSGLAALLLEGGTTAHSRFHLPIDLDATSACRIAPHLAERRLIDRAVLTVWDDALLLSSSGHEAAERFVTDIKSARDPSCEAALFGGICCYY